jgi:hypothetical protein
MNKRILISVSVIAALVLYIVISRVKWLSDVPDIPAWEGKADEIVINRPGSTVKLYKKDGKWVVNDEAYPADERVMDEIDTQLKNTRLVDLISKKGFYNKYDLTPDKYSEIMIKKGDSIFRKFKIGKKSSTGRQTFLRIDDRPDIYLAEATFDLLLNKSVDDFRNKEILKVKRDSISGITINYRGNQFALTRNFEKKEGEKAASKGEKKAPAKTEETWVCKGYESVPLDNTRIESLRASVDPLRASSFLNVPKDSLTHNVCKVQIRAQQKDVSFSIYKKDNKYVVTSSESPYVFVLDNWIAENFFITGVDKLKAGAKDPGAGRNMP